MTNSLAHGSTADDGGSAADHPHSTPRAHNANNQTDVVGPTDRDWQFELFAYITSKFYEHSDG